MNLSNNRLNLTIIGIGTVIFVSLHFSSGAVRRKISGPEDTELSAISAPVNLTPGSNTSPVKSTTHGQSRISHGPASDDLPAEVAYQFALIEEAVLAAGTNVSHTLPEMRAPRFWLIGNLMLDEVYQSQFRHGGRENISSNLALTQLSQYLKSDRAETK